MDMEICNSGGADLTNPVPVSFYDGDPQTDPGAIYLGTNMYDLDIEQGQCITYTFAIDVASLGGAMSGDITIVLNDNGMYAGAIGDPIGTTFGPDELAAQDNPVLECEYDQNFISAPWVLTLPPPPTIAFNFDFFTICPDETATIIATPSGTTGAYTLLWDPTGETTPTIIASPGGDSWYYLELTDECHTVIDSVQIEMGTVDITDIIIVDATDCPGSPTFTPGSIHIFPDDPDWTYEIFTFFPPQNSGFFPGLDGGITYIVHLVDENGCELDTAVFVGLGDNAILANFILDSLRDVTCFGDSDGGAAIENITGGLDPPYNVTWTHTTGPYDTETGIPVGGGDEIDNLFGGLWTVTVTDGEGCAWSYFFEINEPEEMTLDMIYNAPVCYGFNDGSVTVNTDGGNGGYVIEILDDLDNVVNASGSNTANGLDEGWYYTTVVDEKGCTVEGSVFLDDPDPLDVDLILTHPKCYGDLTGMAVADTVMNYSGSYSAITYIWTPPLTVGLGLDTFQNLAAGNYVLTINDENGCTNSFDFTITEPTELVFAELGVEPAYCRLFSYQSGNGVVYAAATGGTADYTYVWSNLNTEEWTNNTTWGGLDPGEYLITVTDDNGCQLTQVLTMDSLNPIAAFTPYGPNFDINGEFCHGLVPIDVNFSNQSLYFANPNDPLADTTFFWNFGFPGEAWQVNHDLSDILDTNYSEKGTYTVCLVAQNKNGCTDTTCMDLIFCDPLIFNPVNVFTPDGDGINDMLTFWYLSQAVKEFHCVIVDRWGHTKYEITDIKDGWNGKDKSGSECSDGVYFYTYVGMAEDGSEFKGQGNVQILRGK